MGNIAFMFTPKVTLSEYQSIAASFGAAMLVVGSGLGDVALRYLSLVESCQFINDKSVD